MNNYTTFYLVRHGETDWNAQKLMQGHTDKPLNINGEKQAKELATQLKNVKIDEVFTSDLIRAKRTAELATLERNLAIKTTEALREGNMGNFEGKRADGFWPLFHEWNKLAEEEKIKDKNYKDYLTVEDHKSVTSRFTTFLREVAVSHPNKNILIVTHGGVLAHFLVNLGLAKAGKVSFPNASLLIIKSDGIEFDLVKMEGVKIYAD